MKKYGLALLFFGLGCGLAVLAARHMTADAAAVVIGVMVGIAAALPTSLLLVALLHRRSAR